MLGEKKTAKRKWLERNTLLCYLVFLLNEVHRCDKNPPEEGVPASKKAGVS